MDFERGLFPLAGDTPANQRGGGGILRKRFFLVPARRPRQEPSEGRFSAAAIGDIHFKQFRLTALQARTPAVDEDVDPPYRKRTAKRKNSPRRHTLFTASTMLFTY